MNEKIWRYEYAYFDKKVNYNDCNDVDGYVVILWMYR